MAKTRIVQGLVMSLFCSATVPALAYQEEIRTTAVRIAERLKASSKKRLAVVDFTDLQGEVTELGRFLAEQLSVALAAEDQDLEVIDRTHLKALLDEHKLAATGLIDPQTARKLGQIASVDALATGSITPFGDSVNLSVKVLDTSTARMVAAATVEIPKTKAIEDLLAKAIGGSASTVGGAPKPARAQPGGAPSRPEPRALYTRAYDDYASRNYDEAISGFTEYTRAYPDTDFTDNAQYWVGECLYGQQKLPEAIAAWNVLFRDYPSSDKIPDARVKKGMALEKLGRRSQALVEYRYVVDRFPGSPAAEVARQRLNP